MGALEGIPILLAGYRGTFGDAFCSVTVNGRDVESDLAQRAQLMQESQVVAPQELRKEVIQRSGSARRIAPEILGMKGLDRR